MNHKSSRRRGCPITESYVNPRLALCFQRESSAGRDVIWAETSLMWDTRMWLLSRVSEQFQVFAWFTGGCTESVS